MLAFMLLLSAGSTQAFAYAIDGDLGDWGVTPFVDWDPDSPTAKHTVQDGVTYTGGPIWGSLGDDHEALYLDMDANSMYFALVSSQAQTSLNASDLKIDIYGTDGQYNFGLDITPLSPSAGIQQVPLLEDPTWITMFGYPSKIPSVAWLTQYGYPVSMHGTNKGSSDVSYKNAGELEPGEGDTYILEGIIDRALLSSSFPDGTETMLSLGYSANDQVPMDISKRRYLSSAFSDRIVLQQSIVIPPNTVIPEPSTILLFGAGLLGAGFFRRKRTKR
ncbi:MAG: PEP-CTERM sorting domain-containing protein [Candidatus Omnitrophica bacterium]|nr:PEP-CTERM sorting domain-containing protein [Candidatus Omnitrophota bacterium]